MATEVCSDRGCRYSCSLLTVEASPRAEAANPCLQVITKHQVWKSHLMRSHPIPWDDVRFSMSKASQTHPSTSQRPVEGTSHPPGSWPLAALSVLQGFSFPPFESPDILSSHPSVSHLSLPPEGKGFSSLLLGVRHIHVKQAVCVCNALSVLWDVVGLLPAQFPWPS